MKINLTQNTPEWEAFRLGKLGASTIPKILGSSPHKVTPLQIWREVMGLSSVPYNPAMARGHEIEPICREACNFTYDCVFTPEVHQCDELPWLIASCDGVSNLGDTLLEIKLVGRKKYEKIRDEGPTQDFIDQMQTQMFVSGIPKNILCIWCDAYGGDESLLTFEVEFDPEYMAEILRPVSEFYYNWVATGTEPEFTEQDYVYIDNPKFYEAEVLYQRTYHILQTAKKDNDHWKEVLISFGDDGNFEGDIVKMTRVERRCVDWNKLCEDKGIDLETIEKYRKPGIGYYKPTLKEGKDG